jgi:hypothetical protein
VPQGRQARHRGLYDGLRQETGQGEQGRDLASEPAAAQVSEVANIGQNEEGEGVGMDGRGRGKETEYERVSRLGIQRECTTVSGADRIARVRGERG